MQMINNYLNSLESYLPEELKDEVREELEASILAQVEDQQEELGRELNEKEQETLLRKIGHPMRVASAYLPKQRLVGSELFPAYKRALEIALVLVLGIVLLVSLPSIFSRGSIIGSGISIFAQMFHTGLYVFAVVTIVFYLMDYYGANLDEIYAWSPKDLRKHSRHLSLKRLETGFELVFYVLFIAWWNDILSWPTDVWMNRQTANLSFSEEWLSVFWSVNIVMGLSVAVGFHKFVVASWNKFSLAADMALALATLVIISQILQFENYINYDGSIFEDPNWSSLATNLDYAVNSILGIIAVICIWDIASNFRKIIGR